MVGGGKVAARKVSLLLRAGAHVRIVSPTLNDNLQKLHESKSIDYICASYPESGIENTDSLVFAATDNPSINQEVARTANQLNIPVNVIDNPSLGSFIMPSIVDRSPVIAAVSTGGASPTLARLIRTRLESLIPAGYGRLASLAETFRSRVREKFTHDHDKRLFWERIFQGGVAERVFSGDMKEAGVLMEKELELASPTENQGEVYLVGAGPGDPDLLTFRALRLMQQADVVVYDRLVAKPILEMTRTETERVYVGKERDNHAMRQEEINELLADLAKQGKRVLKMSFP